MRIWEWNSLLAFRLTSVISTNLNQLTWHRTKEKLEVRGVYASASYVFDLDDLSIRRSPLHSSAIHNSDFHWIMIFTTEVAKAFSIQFKEYVTETCSWLWPYPYVGLWELITFNTTRGDVVFFAHEEAKDSYYSKRLGKLYVWFRLCGRVCNIAFNGFTVTLSLASIKQITSLTVLFHSLKNSNTS